MKAGSARLRLLAAELKHLRYKAGLNVRDAAQLAGMSRASLNRMELGQRVIEPEDMAALLVVYGTRGTERNRLLTLARQLSHPQWWDIPAVHGLSTALPGLLAFESEAIRLAQFEIVRVPGLMQIPAYIREIMRSAELSASAQEARVAIRLKRQKLLTRPRPPHYLALLDEGLLHRPVGGPAVMAAQLRHMIGVAGSLPHVDLRVVPLRHGAYTGMDGSFVAMEFAKADPIVYLEHKRGSHFIDDGDMVGSYLEAAETITDIALGPAESLDLIARIAEKHDQGVRQDRSCP